jgi:putative N-acetyltransferase (TIGR04045 family)
MSLEIIPDIRHSSRKDAELTALGSQLAESPVTCRLAESQAELDLHFGVRHEVFVREQVLFSGTDRDCHDGDSATLHVLGFSGSFLGGVVRLYPLDEKGLWKGDRLAVLPPYRKLALGAALVRFAVRTAGEGGGETMIANVQVQNVRFFEFLNWNRVGDPFEYVGQPHQKMAIELSAPESVGDRA